MSFEGQYNFAAPRVCHDLGQALQQGEANLVKVWTGREFPLNNHTAP